MVQIDELVLRIEGLTTDEAQQLGKDIAGEMASRVPENIDEKKVSNLNVKVALPVDAKRDRWAAIIAEQVVRQLMIGT